MVSSDVVINVPHDVDRQLAKLVSEAGKFSSRIYLLYRDKSGNSAKKINAKSYMGVVSMVPSNGDVITVTAEGEDEDAAAEAIKSLLSK